MVKSVDAISGVGFERSKRKRPPSWPKRRAQESTQATHQARDAPGCSACFDPYPKGRISGH